MRIMPFMKRKRGIQFAGVGIDSGGGGDTSALANKTDLTAIILTGTTNTSGDVISAGTWFYLNGTPCVAKVDIASGATFTEGTNYEEKTVGSALSELNSNISESKYVNVIFETGVSGSTSLYYRGGYITGYVWINIPAEKLSTNSPLFTFQNYYVESDMKFQGFKRGASPEIFHTLGGNKLAVDNNFDIPSAGDYFINIFISAYPS